MKAVSALSNPVDAIQKQFFSMIHKSKNIEYELISRLGKSGAKNNAAKEKDKVEEARFAIEVSADHLDF